MRETTSSEESGGRGAGVASTKHIPAGRNTGDSPHALTWRVSKSPAAVCTNVRLRRAAQRTTCVQNAHDEQLRRPGSDPPRADASGTLSISNTLKQNRQARMSALLARMPPPHLLCSHVPQRQTSAAPRPPSARLCAPTTPHCTREEGLVVPATRPRAAPPTRTRVSRLRAREHGLESTPPAPPLPVVAIGALLLDAHPTSHAGAHLQLGYKSEPLRSISHLWAGPVPHFTPPDPEMLLYEPSRKSIGQAGGRKKWQQFTAVEPAARVTPFNAPPSTYHFRHSAITPTAPAVPLPAILAPRAPRALRLLAIPPQPESLTLQHSRHKGAQPPPVPATPAPRRDAFVWTCLLSPSLPDQCRSMITGLPFTTTTTYARPIGPARPLPTASTHRHISNPLWPTLSARAA
ncbi:hypothetical protein DFH09DRAFT_1462023 [Mycena vulgaris]|nr:hypothetical protein DFH09DRAFT_1462023 [Mycena vulgaris]